MLASLLLVFREMLEAGLIVGVVLAATRGIPRRGYWVMGGIAAGVVGAGLLALAAKSLTQAVDGMGQELFNACILLVAVVMLGWHNVWMARHGRVLAAEMRAVGEAVRTGSRSLTALAVVVGIAVLREGAEVVMFMYGVAASSTDSNLHLLLGGLAGLALGAAVSALIFFGLMRIPMRHLFAVTSGLITLLAAGLAAQAVKFLQKADVITVLQQKLWDTSSLLSEKSLVGQALKTLIGYTDRPNGMQLIAYLATVLTITLLMKWFNKPSAQ